MKFRATNKLTQESGMALVLACVLIPVVLGFALFGFFWVQRATEQVYLQTLVDSMAHSAATTLESSKLRFTSAQGVALKMFSESEAVHRYLNGVDPGFSLLSADDVPVWTSNGLTLRIYRGRWLDQNSANPVIADLPKFEPFEADVADSFSINDWQADHPGIPAPMAANAVYVSLEVENANLINNFFGQVVPALRPNLLAVAAATSGEVGLTEAAPFAIPVCALTDAAGEFNPDVACQYDRYFTETDRYCGAEGGNCAVLPGFFSSAVASTVQFDSISTNSDILQAGQVYTCAAGFADLGLPDVADNFGVIGLSQSALADGVPLTEAGIRGRIQQLGGSFPARIGDSFSVLRQGFQQQASDAAIWNLISGQLDRPGYVIATGDFKHTNNLRISVFRGRLSDSVVVKPSGPVLFPKSAFEAGTCNSRIAAATKTSYGGDANCLHTSVTGMGFDQGPTGSPVVRLRVPVIADPANNASSCAGYLGEITDPPVQAGNAYIIIGFIEAVLFDVDIGTPPPDNLGYDNPNLGGPPGPAYFNDRQPWGFSPGGVTRNCNVVRMRTSCESRLLPTRQTGDTRTPKLTE